MSTNIWLTTTPDVKKTNKHAILDLIRFTPGGISRVEISRHMALSRAAVTTIVNGLIASHIVREAESLSVSNGQPPVQLEINPTFGQVAGLDFGTSHLSIIIADLAAHILDEIEVELDITRGPETCFAEANRLLHERLIKVNLRLHNILAIGVGVPGPIVTEAGLALSPLHMPGWDRYPIRDTLEKRWGCPVSLNNDAELGALGEWAAGAGRGEGNLFYIKAGNCIGAGLLLDGQIYHGVTGLAGEIGHLIIDEKGPLCSCGNQGCLEVLASGRAIAIQAQNTVRHGKCTQLVEIQPVENISAREVASAACRGDLLAQHILTQAGTYIGIALADLINLFNPGMIVIGGGVAQAGDLLLEPMRQAMQKRSLSASGRVVRIAAALLGRRSSAMGAVVQALTIALHQVADRKEVRLPHVTSSKSLSFSKSLLIPKQ